MKAFIAATEFPGHAFPEFALAKAMRERGHEVLVSTSERWREAVRGFGADVLTIEEVGGVTHHGTFGSELVDAAQRLRVAIESFAPQVVVSDMASAAPPLAGELAGLPVATVIALVFPVEQRGMPFYPHGLRPPRSTAGAAAWEMLERPAAVFRPRTKRLRAVGRELDAVRLRLGLPPHASRPESLTSYGSISEQLTLVATFPQLEYPRRWPAHVHVTGPMLYEPVAVAVEPPPGEAPLVLIAGSTAQDPQLELVRVAIAALAGEPVRVLATTSGHRAGSIGPLPDNARVVEWLSLDRVLGETSVVIARGGHGIVSRALAAGVPLLVCPAGGDMPENGARVAWAGAGLTVPRPLLGTAAVRAGTRRLIADRRFRDRARELADWNRRNDGAQRGAELVEELAADGWSAR